MIGSYKCLRLQGSLSEYELRAWTSYDSHVHQAAQRLYFHDEAEALALLRRLLVNNSVSSLRSLFDDFDGFDGFGFAHESEVERVARLIVRGQIVVVRVPLVPAASDPLPEGLHEPYEHEPQEIEEYISAVGDIRVEPPFVSSSNVEVEPPACASGLCEVEPPACASGWCEVEPPLVVMPSIGIVAPN